MAKNKTKPRKKKKKNRNKGGKLRPFLWGLLFCLLLGATLIATAYFIFLTPGTQQKTTSSLPAKLEIHPTYKPINSLPYEEDAPPQVTRLKPDHIKKKQALHKPQIAIIIDDMGYRYKVGQELIRLDMGLSFAFLPFTTHTQSLMDLAASFNTDILLHLPMEPSSTKWDPGVGSLYTSMDTATIMKQVEKDLTDVPLAIGVNNHMGSKFTSHKTAMQAALTVIKNKNLFFLDSVTSSTSIAYATALELGMKTGRRDIFLDNEQNDAKIKMQLEKLVQRARKNGSAIGIGHPYPATLATLKKEQWWLKNQVELVGISALVKRR